MRTPNGVDQSSETHLLFTLERFGYDRPQSWLDSRFTIHDSRPLYRRQNTRETTDQVQVNDYFNVTKVKYIIIIHHICTR